MAEVLDTPNKQRKFLCCGSTRVDVVTTVDDEYVEDQLLKGLQSHWRRGGNASNVCTVLSSLGGHVELMSTFVGSKGKRIDDDYYTKFILNDLKECGISYEHSVFHDNVQCPMAQVFLNSNSGSRTTVYTSSDHPEISLSHFQKLNLENYKWIHFEGRCAEQALMMMHIREWNKGRTKEDRISISLEVEQPTGEYEITAQLADYVFVSKTMAQKLGLKGKQEAVKSGSLTGIDGENVIVLCGSDGAFSRISGYIYGYDAHPPPNGVVDRIGAGECFIANTIYALSRGNPIREAIPFGCRVAGYKVGVLGLKGLKTVQQVMYNRCFNKPL